MSWRCLFTVRGDAPLAATVPQRVDLTCGDLGGWSATKGNHDRAGMCAVPAAVARTGLGEQIAMVAERRGLRLLHVSQPFEVGLCDSAECDRRVRFALRFGCLSCEFGFDLPHESVLGDDRAMLIEETGLDAPPATD